MPPATLGLDERPLPKVRYLNQILRPVNSNLTCIPASTPGNNGIGYWGESGTLRVTMSDLGISYAGGNGIIIRAWMNADRIAYYDENFNVVWSTDCAPNC